MVQKVMNRAHRKGILPNLPHNNVSALLGLLIHSPQMIPLAKKICVGIFPLKYTKMPALVMNS
jgi:hypothetical protein